MSGKRRHSVTCQRGFMRMTDVILQLIKLLNPEVLNVPTFPVVWIAGSDSSAQTW